MPFAINEAVKRIDILKADSRYHPLKVQKEAPIPKLVHSSKKNKEQYSPFGATKNNNSVQRKRHRYQNILSHTLQHYCLLLFTYKTCDMFALHSLFVFEPRPSSHSTKDGRKYIKVYEVTTSKQAALFSSFIFISKMIYVGCTGQSLLLICLNELNRVALFGLFTFALGKIKIF